MGTHPIFESDFDCLNRMSSKDVIEMSGCGTVEIDVTKMFWKSFTLSPPTESELFSPDIRQRRRTAPPAGRSSSRKRSETSRVQSSYISVPFRQNFDKDFLEEEPTKDVISYGHQKRSSPETDDEIESVKNLDFFRS